MNIGSNVLRITFSQRALPRRIFSLLRAIEVVSFKSQLRIGTDSGDAIHFVEPAIHEELHASIPDEGAFQHHGGGQSSLESEIDVHRVRTLNVLRLKYVRQRYLADSVQNRSDILIVDGELES